MVVVGCVLPASLMPGMINPSSGREFAVGLMGTSVSGRSVLDGISLPIVSSAKDF